MKLKMSWKFFLITCWPCLASAQLQLLPDTEPQVVFGPGVRTVHLVWRNSGPVMISIPVRMQVYQASSSIAAAWNQAQDWKQLRILPRQTILENAPLTVPAVKSETRFIVQWLDETEKVVGHTDLMVYPTNILNQLKPLMGDAPLGVFDPQNQLKPLLKTAALNFEDLEDEGFKRFSGRLAIVAPQGGTQTGPTTCTIAALARKGVSVVWIPAASEHGDKPRPSFYLVPKGKGTVLVADAGLVADLPGNPRSQLNLISLSKLAMCPETFTLPEIKDDPQP